MSLFFRQNQQTPCATTRTEALGWRLSCHNVFENNSLSICFANGPIKLKINYATVENFEQFEPTWPLRKQPSNSWMWLVRLQTNLRIFYGASFPPKFNVPFYIVLYTICPTFCACLSFEFALAIQLFCIQHSTSIYMQHSSFRFRHSTFHKQQSRFPIRPSSSVECTFIFSHAIFIICPLVFASDIRLWALYLQVSAFDI